MHDLHDDAFITAYAYKPTDADTRERPRIGCHDDEIDTSTLGTTEMLATAFFGVAQLTISPMYRFVLPGLRWRVSPSKAHYR